MGISHGSSHCPLGDSLKEKDDGYSIEDCSDDGGGTERTAGFCTNPAKTDKAATPAVSDAEMDKYYAAMQERYKKMQDGMGPGGEMGPGSRMGPGAGMGPMSPEMMDQRQRRMEQRMDMMQMMMDQMMQHQGMSGPMPGAK